MHHCNYQFTHHALPIFMTPSTLTDRRQRILAIVVQEYVQAATPVSSKNIAERYNLGVSAATIRNDLAALEEEGLLTHPHTSAGRVPTDAGYRFFVHNLLADADLPRTEQLTIRNEFQRVPQEIEQWLRLSAAVLARTSQAAALATAPRAIQSAFKHMELVAIHDTKVLLVLVLQEGAIKQQILDLDEALAQEALSRTSNELNDKLDRATSDDIEARLALLSPFAQQVALLVVETMQRLDNRVGGQVFRDGLAQVLGAPEFYTGSKGGESARRIISVFEERSLLEEIINRYVERLGNVDGPPSAMGDVHVLIAGDGRIDELADMSLIISRYGVAEQATGLLGVVGPLRMPYGRSIGAVRFVAALMSELVEDVYGFERRLPLGKISQN